MKTTTTLEREYEEMLGVLPPRKMGSGPHGVSGFLVGEATTHGKNGAVYASYFTSGDSYISGPNMTPDEFTKALSLKWEELTENEETPDNVQTELDLMESHSPEAVAAYHALGIENDNGLENFEEAYAGQFDNDSEFAQDMAYQLGSIQKDVQWPYTCIDWEYAAKELMYDYSEEYGHYFRNL